MDASLALVPVYAFPPSSSRVDGGLVKYSHNRGGVVREAERVIDDPDRLSRTYGLDGRETVKSANGALVDTYI